MSERSFNARLDELIETLDRSMPRKSGRVIAAAERAFLRIESILERYADDAGVIPRSRQSAVLAEVRALEGELYRALQRELEVVFNSTAEATYMTLSTALASELAIAPLLALIEATKAPTTAAALFAAVMGLTKASYIDELVGAAFDRTGSDKLRLNDRIRNLARFLTRTASDTLRKSIREGGVTEAAKAAVKKAFRDARWRFKTIVETEALFIMRHGIGLFAELSGLASAVRIQDYPHGEPGYHERHKCYEYARANDHGLGRGVYPASTRKIRNPHPRCRATLHIVFKNSLKGGR